MGFDIIEIILRLKSDFCKVITNWILYVHVKNISFTSYEGGLKSLCKHNENTIFSGKLKLKTLFQFYKKTFHKKCFPILYLQLAWILNTITLIDLRG